MAIAMYRSSAIVLVITLTAAVPCLGAADSPQPTGLKCVELPPGMGEKEVGAFKASSRFETWQRGEFLSVGPEAAAMQPSGTGSAACPQSSVAPCDPLHAGSVFAQRTVHETSYQPDPNAPSELTSAEARELQLQAERDIRDAGKRAEYIRWHTQARLAARQKTHKGMFLASVRVCDSVDAAQECMIASCLTNSLPLEMKLALCSDKTRFGEVGDIAFLHIGRGGRTIRFVRNNVFVSIKGHGCFESDVEVVAKKIDAALTKGQMSKAQFDARKPRCSVNLSKETDKQGRRSLDIAVDAPEGGKVVRESVVSLDGKAVRREETGFYLDKGVKKTRVRVMVLTDELLGCIVEQEVSVD